MKRSIDAEVEYILNNYAIKVSDYYQRTLLVRFEPSDTTLNCCLKNECEHPKQQGWHFIPVSALLALFPKEMRAQNDDHCRLYDIAQDIVWTLTEALLPSNQKPRAKSNQHPVSSSKTVRFHFDSKDSHSS